MTHMNMNSSGTDTCAEKTHKLWACTSPQVFAVTLPATPLPVRAARCAGGAPLRWGASGRGDSAPGSSESLGSRKDAWTKQIPRADRQITKPKMTRATFNVLGVVHTHVILLIFTKTPAETVRILLHLQVGNLELLEVDVTRLQPKGQ